MRSLSVSKDFFKQNRLNFCNNLKKKSIAIFNSNDEFPKTGDQTFPFKQNADFFYLCGINQEESILILFPDAPNQAHREILFLKKTDEHLALWEGAKHSKEEAREISGVEKIFWLDEFWSFLSSLIQYADFIYLNTNESDRYRNKVPYRDLRFIYELKKWYPLHHYERSAPILRGLRAHKSNVEINIIKKACDITNDAFLRVLLFLKPGIKEYEIEAEIIHEFIRQGSAGHAFDPIIASGSNASILHYNNNRETCKDGDMVLLDFGAEYSCYKADISRTIPVNGRFSKRQKEVYEAVLCVLKAAKAMLLPGVHPEEYRKEISSIMEQELIRLKLLDPRDIARQRPDAPLYKQYFMHGISHHLGIDVHDLADPYKTFEPGNVLTCEPGIYIPAEGLGIRLENNILITHEGNLDLTQKIPIEIDEIEEIMNA